MAVDPISFNKSPITSLDLQAAFRVLNVQNTYSGGGYLYKEIIARLPFEEEFSPFLVTSGTAALELAFMSLAESGEARREVILPSYTFTSCANSVIRCGLKPVFADIQLNDGCIDLNCVDDLISTNTLAVMFVDYAGVCSFKSSDIARYHSLGVKVVIDAAQSFGSPHWQASSEYRFVDYITFSFHDTKNISCGEGGLLLVNTIQNEVSITAVAFEKGTDRREFLNGKVDKYSWKSVGSSFIISEINLAVLNSQLGRAKNITSCKVNNWRQVLREVSRIGCFDLIQCSKRSSNGHFAWGLTRRGERASVQRLFDSVGVQTTTHYEPLHSSSFGKTIGTASDCSRSTKFSEAVLRLPCHSEEVIERLKSL